MVKVIKVDSKLDDLEGLENKLNKVFQDIHDKGSIILNINTFEGKLNGIANVSYMIIVEEVDY